VRVFGLGETWPKKPFTPGPKTRIIFLSCIFSPLHKYSERQRSNQKIEVSVFDLHFLKHHQKCCETLHLMLVIIDSNTAVNKNDFNNFE
jgi:hypothetical protein